MDQILKLTIILNSGAIVGNIVIGYMSDILHGRRLPIYFVFLLISSGLNFLLNFNPDLLDYQKSKLVVFLMFL